MLKLVLKSELKPHQLKTHFIKQIYIQQIRNAKKYNISWISEQTSCLTFRTTTISVAHSNNVLLLYAHIMFHVMKLTG